MHLTRSTLARLQVSVAAACMPGWCFAQASVPYTPSVSARHAIEFLVDDANMPLTVTQWPLPVAAVQDALDALPAQLSPAQQQARDRVAPELRRRALGQWSGRLANRRNSAVAFGDEAVPGSSLRARSATWKPSDSVAVQLGVRLEQPPVMGAVPTGTTSRDAAQLRLDDAAAVIDVSGVNFQAASRQSWWGPGWQDSLILGNNTPALNGFGFQRGTAAPSDSPWLAWLGPWNFDFFMVEQEGHSEPKHAWFMGNRLTIKPHTSVEIGLTRTAQWGGQGRPQSLSNFAAMLTGSGTNADTTTQQYKDPGNQMAGYDLRVRCPADLPCVGYTQWIGEDMAGLLPSRFLTLYGMEFWSGDGRNRYTAEYIDTMANDVPGHTPLPAYSYRNYQYPEGYASGRRWLGAGVGPDAQVLSLGWFGADSRTSIKLRAGVLNGVNLSASGTSSPASIPGAVVAYASARARYLAGQWQQEYDWVGGTFTPQLGWQRLTGSGRQVKQVQFGASWRLEWDGSTSGAPSATESSSQLAWPSLQRAPLLSGIGLLVAGLALDRPSDRFATQHGNTDGLRAIRQAGSALPVIAMGLAGADWLTHLDAGLSQPGTAAVSAVITAYAASRVAKALIRRDRPTGGLGPDSFGHSAKASDSSFPSTHAAMAWAVLTPYAEATGSNIPYLLAGLTSVSRVLGRHHWASDSVGGSLMGYGIGRLAVGTLGNTNTVIVLQPKGLALATPLN